MCTRARYCPFHSSTVALWIIRRNWHFRRPIDRTRYLLFLTTEKHVITIDPRRPRRVMAWCNNTTSRASEQCQCPNAHCTVNRLLSISIVAVHWSKYMPDGSSQLFAKVIEIKRETRVSHLMTSLWRHGPPHFQELLIETRSGRAKMDNSWTNGESMHNVRLQGRIEGSHKVYLWTY